MFLFNSNFKMRVSHPPCDTSQSAKSLCPLVSEIAFIRNINHSVNNSDNHAINDPVSHSHNDLVNHTVNYFVNHPVEYAVCARYWGPVLLVELLFVLLMTSLFEFYP